MIFAGLAAKREGNNDAEGIEALQRYESYACVVRGITSWFCTEPLHLRHLLNVLKLNCLDQLYHFHFSFWKTPENIKDIKGHGRASPFI